MKFTKSYLASLLLLSGAFAACDDDPELPPVYIPTATIEANTSIADVKAEYWSDEQNYVKTVGTKDNGDHIIIAGRVVSSDYSGNIYNSIVIQDETAALSISVKAGDDLDSLAQRYKIGAEIVIDLTDAYIGKYAGLQQMGYPGEYNGTPQASFMTSDYFKERAQINGLPDPTKIDTIATSIAEINAIGKDAAKTRQWQSQLIRLDSVYFAEGGKTVFAATESTNSTLLDKEGNSIILRNSSYATFHNDTLPSGFGSIVGILSYYNGTWQILLRNIDDCIDFSGELVTPEIPAAETNTTIADLKATYWDDATNYCIEVGVKDDGTHTIIKGRVISSDATGNIYKTLYIQDETGAISIPINSSTLYNTYPLGQEIVIDVTGLVVGKYAGLQQIGVPSEYNGTPQTGRMEASVFSSHVISTEAADESKINAITTTLDVIAAAKSAEDIRVWQNQLVRFENVYFKDGGQATFSESSASTNRTLLDSNGNSIIVRTSNYATFKDEILPSGTGTVTGIMSYYNGTWQLLLRNAEDCNF